MANGSNPRKVSPPREYSKGTPLTGLKREVERLDRDNAYRAGQENANALTTLINLLTNGVVNQICSLTGEVILVPGTNMIITVNAKQNAVVIATNVPPADSLMTNGDSIAPDLLFHSGDVLLHIP